MKIVKSKYDDFCPGVRRAVDLCNSQIAKNADRHADIFLSSLICHNVEVNKRIGLKIMPDGFFDKKHADGIVLILSAHGAKKELLQRCGVNADIVSAICPVVKNNLNEIKRIAQEHDSNFILIYIGKAGHTEAEAARSYMPESAIFISDIKDAEKIVSSRILDNKIIEIMIQTSFSDEIANDIIKVFKNSGIAFRQFNFICSDCLRRREEAERISMECDAVLVVGDERSSNARELANIAKKNTEESYLVMNVDELKHIMTNISKCQRTGIISCASSSREIFDEICDYLEKNCG